METRCPHCHEPILSDAMGQVVGCPHCQNSFTMPKDDLAVANPLSVLMPTEAAGVPGPQQPGPNPAENIQIVTTAARVERRHTTIYKGMRNTLLLVVGLLFVLVALSYAYPHLLRSWKEYRSSEGAVREASDPTEGEQSPVDAPKPGRSFDQLVRIALESADPAEQEKAVIELAEFGRPAIRHLQRVMAESQSDRVRESLVQELASREDYDYMPVLLDALADPSPVVRGRAGAAVQQLLGPEFRFSSRASPEEREVAIAARRKEWERLSKSPAFESRQWRRSLERLVRVALDSTDPVEQEKAAVELTELGRPALKHLRRVLAESQTDAVRAAVIQGLAFQQDYESMDAFLDAMEDPSPVVRGRAGVAVERLVGLDIGFDADDPLERREKMVAAMRKEWKNLQDSPNFQVRMKEMQSQR